MAGRDVRVPLKSEVLILLPQTGLRFWIAACTEESQSGSTRCSALRRPGWYNEKIYLYLHPAVLTLRITQKNKGGPVKCEEIVPQAVQGHVIESHQLPFYSV